MEMAVSYDSLYSDVEGFCASLVACEDLPEPMQYAAKCENEFLDDGEIARDESRACAKSFEFLVHCIAGLSCDEYRNWGANYSNEDSASTSYPCEQPTDEFLESCDRTWFSVNVRP